jgi:hypothetical protein
MGQVDTNEVAIADLPACGDARTAAELHVLTEKLPNLVKKELDVKHFDDQVKAMVHVQTLAAKPDEKQCIEASRRWADAELFTFRMLYRIEPRND